MDLDADTLDAVLDGLLTGGQADASFGDADPVLHNLQRYQDEGGIDERASLDAAAVLGHSESPDCLSDVDWASICEAEEAGNSSYPGTSPPDREHGSGASAVKWLPFHLGCARPPGSQVGAPSGTTALGSTFPPSIRDETLAQLQPDTMQPAAGTIGKMKPQTLAAAASPDSGIASSSSALAHPAASSCTAAPTAPPSVDGISPTTSTFSVFASVQRAGITPSSATCGATSSSSLSDGMPCGSAQPAHPSLLGNHSSSTRSTALPGLDTTPTASCGATVSAPPSWPAAPHMPPSSCHGFACPCCPRYPMPHSGRGRHTPSSSNGPQHHGAHLGPPMDRRRQLSKAAAAVAAAASLGLPPPDLAAMGLLPRSGPMAGCRGVRPAATSAGSGSLAYRSQAGGGGGSGSRPLRSYASGTLRADMGYHPYLRSQCSGGSPSLPQRSSCPAVPGMRGAEGRVSALGGQTGGGGATEGGAAGDGSGGGMWARGFAPGPLSTIVSEGGGYGGASCGGGGPAAGPRTGPAPCAGSDSAPCTALPAGNATVRDSAGCGVDYLQAAAPLYGDGTGDLGDADLDFDALLAEADTPADGAPLSSPPCVPTAMDVDGATVHAPTVACFGADSATDPSRCQATAPKATASACSAAAGPALVPGAAAILAAQRRSSGGGARLLELMAQLEEGGEGDEMDRMLRAVLAERLSSGGGALGGGGGQRSGGSGGGDGTMPYGGREVSHAPSLYAAAAPVSSSVSGNASGEAVAAGSAMAPGDLLETMGSGTGSCGAAPAYPAGSYAQSASHMPPSLSYQRQSRAAPSGLPWQQQPRPLAPPPPLPRLPKLPHCTLPCCRPHSAPAYHHGVPFGYPAPGHASMAPPPHYGGFGPRGGPHAGAQHPCASTASPSPQPRHAPAATAGYPDHRYPSAPPSHQPFSTQQPPAAAPSYCPCALCAAVAAQPQPPQPSHCTLPCCVPAAAAAFRAHPPHMAAAGAPCRLPCCMPPPPHAAARPPAPSVGATWGRAPRAPSRHNAYGRAPHQPQQQPPSGSHMYPHGYGNASFAAPQPQRQSQPQGWAMQSVAYGPGVHGPPAGGAADCSGRAIAPS